MQGKRSSFRRILSTNRFSRPQRSLPFRTLKPTGCVLTVPNRKSFHSVIPTSNHCKQQYLTPIPLINSHIHQRTPLSSTQRLQKSHTPRFTTTSCYLFSYLKQAPSSPKKLHPSFTNSLTTSSTSLSLLNHGLQLRNMTLSIQRRNKRKKGLNINHNRRDGEPGWEETDEGPKIGGALIPESFSHLFDPDHIRAGRYIHRNRKQERKVESLQRIHARSQQKKDFRKLIDPEETEGPRLLQEGKTLRQLRLGSMVRKELEEIFDSELVNENRWFNVARVEILDVDLNINCSLAQVSWTCENKGYTKNVQRELKSASVLKLIRFSLTERLSWLKKALNVTFLPPTAHFSPLEKNLDMIEKELELNSILGTDVNRVIAQYAMEQETERIVREKEKASERDELNIIKPLIVKD